MGLVAFTYAYLPLPAVAIWSWIFGDHRKLVGSTVSLCVGILGVYLLLLFVTQENTEVIGDTIIIRHAGPELNQASDFESYIFPVIVMVVTIKLYWHILAKETKKNET